MTTTKRRRFDPRRASVWLLTGALGLTLGATVRVGGNATPPPATSGVPLVTRAPDGTQQVILVRRSAFEPVARTRAS